MPHIPMPVTLGEIPCEIMDQPATYSVTLVGVEQQNKLAHCGTGTLVTFHNQYFILTCNHCAQPFFKSDRIGLPIRIGGWPLFIQKLPPIYIGQYTTKEWGQDLAFIPVASLDAAIIRNSSNKTFYNLQNHQDEMLRTQPRTDSLLWAIVGSPISESNIEGPIEFHFMRKTYTGTIESSPTRDDFDYHEIRASLAGQNADDTFMKGVSGGGLWYANLGKHEDGSFILTERPRLEGVAFYRTNQDGDYVRIRCHGRRSIYQHALTALG
jgi:hypothetical protein